MFKRLTAEAPTLFAPGAKRKSDFFRDIAGSQYLATGEAVAKEAGIRYDFLLNVFDRSIIEVENRVYGDSIKRHLLAALERTFVELPDTASRRGQVEAPIKGILDTDMEETYVVGTGYGRARLPFSKEHVRSEILCHGLGAHVMYPGTATVLDIGGQDTKAIQVDPSGIVESFQMNDRCAAGCGRYLGYIADEMNMGLHELGPMAMKSTKTIRINSTCTVFAGAELRDRLSLGDSREDIMAGLHRAIILRAMSILARSGGIRNEFTFTGGVAKNEAAVKALKDLVARELRRPDAQHQSGLDLHRGARRRDVRLARGGRGREDRGGAGMRHPVSTSGGVEGQGGAVMGGVVGAASAALGTGPCVVADQARASPRRRMLTPTDLNA